MPVSGFTQDLNPNYYVRKPGKREILDEAIYYRRDEPFERPVEIATRPVVKETVFMPDRKAPPLANTRDMYTVYPETGTTVYTTTNVPPNSSFNIIRALALNADCPCWSWILIVLGFIILIALIAMCLYFVLQREGYI